MKDLMVIDFNKTVIIKDRDDNLITLIGEPRINDPQQYSLKSWGSCSFKEYMAYPNLDKKLTNAVKEWFKLNVNNYKGVQNV